MIDFISLNTNLLPFLLMFLLGVLFLLIAPISYRMRKKVLIILPTTILGYNKYEKIILIAGVFLVAWSLFSIEKKCRKEGYNTYVTELNGTRTVERIFPGSYD